MILRLYDSAYSARLFTGRIQDVKKISKCIRTSMVVVDKVRESHAGLGFAKCRLALRTWNWSSDDVFEACIRAAPASKALTYTCVCHLAIHADHCRLVEMRWVQGDCPVSIGCIRGEEDLQV